MRFCKVSLDWDVSSLRLRCEFLLGRRLAFFFFCSTALILGWRWGILNSGVILTDPSSPANFSQGHHRTGLVLFILVVLQVIVGVALKGMPKKAKTTRVAIKGHPIQNLFHVLSGVSPPSANLY